MRHLVLHFSIQITTRQQCGDISQPAEFPAEKKNDATKQTNTEYNPAWSIHGYARQASSTMIHDKFIQA
jgi:hypothetical protein